MKQLQFYKYTTWALLILNIAMVAFFFMTAPPPHQESVGGQQTAMDILKLDKNQNESFLQFAQQHQQQMKKFDDQQRDLLQPYFSHLIDERKVDSDSLLSQLESLERKKVELTYQHFKEVKSILKAEQYDDFEQFMKHALNRILSKQNSNPPPPKKVD